ncbi:TetR/AcrR family transcriptional regulator [Streptomyces sp. NPDC051453]|uniref:TetR/AcrR family transcriptional regulator n=1 Tax=Streptomyces sp. NPDC051453 TaxID=3154941 RepID=UPI003420BBFC
MFSEPVQSRVERRESSRRKVLASAERLFREQGFESTTIRQIAVDAGVSAGTVMAVGDKGALLVSLFDGWIEAVHKARGDHSPGEPPCVFADAVDEAMALFEPFVTYFARNRELSREYAAIIVRGSHESEIFQDLALTLIAEVQGVLARSGLGADEAGAGARLVYFSYLGLLMTAANGALDEQAATAQLRDVVTFVISTSGEEE